MTDNKAALVALATPVTDVASSPFEVQHDQPLATAVHLYLREISTVPLLTAAQEVALAVRVAAGAV